MNKDVIIGAIVGLGLLAGTVATAGVINNDQINSGYRVQSKKPINEKTEPKIETKRETREIAIPFETKYYDDATLAKGSTKVVQEGKAGFRTVEYEVTYSNGI